MVSESGKRTDKAGALARAGLVIQPISQISTQVQETFFPENHTPGGNFGFHTGLEQFQCRCQASFVSTIQVAVL
jgi:hypothetical protein